jgi:predicted nuclease of predicted toxin-antitoxin system
MSRFLIDANLPYRFACWRGPDFEHVFDHDDRWSDRDIWDYARFHDQVIVTKDADFSNWIICSSPPPRVVHLRVGNMRIRDLHAFVQRIWPTVAKAVEAYKLVIVRADTIECVD